MAQAARGVASMSVSDKTQHYKVKGHILLDTMYSVCTPFTVVMICACNIHVHVCDSEKKN